MAGEEAKIERAVCAHALNKLGVPNFKWGVDGWPDRCFLLPNGRPLFIEYKAPGEEPEPRQAFRIKCLKTWGYEVYVHDNAKESIHQITRSLAAARLSKESNQIPVGARVRSFVPRPRIREVKYNIGSNKNSAPKESSKKGVGDSAPQGVLQRVARGDRKVARLFKPKD